jgi:cold shock CspA family protein
MSITGRVKWFNNKSGFGFITVCDGPHKGKDIFAHFSAIRGESSQYKYLVQGEYLEFNLVKSESEQHEYNAADITGIMGGILMCDTHRLNQSQGPSQNQSQSEFNRKPRIIERR